MGSHVLAAYGDLTGCLDTSVAQFIADCVDMRWRRRIFGRLCVAFSVASTDIRWSIRRFDCSRPSGIVAGEFRHRVFDFF